LRMVQRLLLQYESSSFVLLLYRLVSLMWLEEM